MKMRLKKLSTTMSSLKIWQLIISAQMLIDRTALTKEQRMLLGSRDLRVGKKTLSKAFKQMKGSLKTSSKLQREMILMTIWGLRKETTIKARANQKWKNSVWATEAKIFKLTPINKLLITSTSTILLIRSQGKTGTVD